MEIFRYFVVTGSFKPIIFLKFYCEGVMTSEKSVPKIFFNLHGFAVDLKRGRLFYPSGNLNLYCFPIRPNQVPDLIIGTVFYEFAGFSRSVITVSLFHGDETVKQKRKFLIYLDGLSNWLFVLPG